MIAFINSFPYPRHSDLLTFSYSVDDHGTITEYEVENVLTKSCHSLPSINWLLLMKLDGSFDPYSLDIEKHVIDEAIRSFEEADLIETGKWLSTGDISYKWLCTLEPPNFMVRIAEVIWDTTLAVTAVLAAYYIISQHNIMYVHTIPLLVILCVEELFHFVIGDLLTEFVQVVSHGDRIASLYRTNIWTHPFFASYKHSGDPITVPDLRECGSYYTCFVFGLFLLLGLFLNDPGLCQCAALTMIIRDVLNEIFALMEKRFSGKDIQQEPPKEQTYKMFSFFGKVLFLLVFWHISFLP